MTDSSSKLRTFSRAEQRPSFPELANTILARWKKEKTFEESLARSKNKPEYIFYDGPPFPTGNPHHGTIFVSILKDLVPRYKTMRGYYVPRAWGWDCHGLPVETQAEKNLGITDKTEIGTKISVGQFNDECHRIVSQFNDAWKIYIDRIGRWVDFDNPYRTMDRDFMESVMWAFAEIYKKGLIYKDFRVSPYCYRCQTPLSISDIRLDDATRPRQDRTATVKFAVRGEEKTFFVAWTTTPWTLPSNLALAVGPELTYALVEHQGEKLYLAEGCLKSYERELGKTPTVLLKIQGKDLIAKDYRYQPMFPYFADKNPNGFKLLSGDFVTTDEGTGIVHIAPAFGEDDYWLCRKYNIGVQGPVDARGNFTEEVTDFVGQNVHEANGPIIKLLKERGVLVREQTVEHNYPHCWRCRNALIYKALDAWYMKVEAIKDDMLKLNQEISWYPGSVKDGRFGKWLENARDWNISRNRFWATPIPVWECDTCDQREVFGAASEIEAKAGIKVPDLHKQFLDPIHFPCTCGGTMRHVPEVLDCWFESGSMPYGQWHYPFERAEHFRTHFPSDFIVEYSGQIRGWFYLLHVLSTALFGKPAFKNCMVTGNLLAADGKKISKSLKNYTDPLILLDRFGPDALRAYLISSVCVIMDDSNFKDEGVEEMVRSINLPLWNALLFFTTYAEIDKVTGADIQLAQHKNNLTENDRYILSELELLTQSITEKLDNYGLYDAVRELPAFLDTLNNWYIRRSRHRVWSAEPRSTDKLAFYATLYRVLSMFTKILAPFCPFLAEAVWEKLLGKESVHFEAWPEVDAALIDKKLSAEIATVRRIITAGLAIRSREKIRVRQPLQTVQFVLDAGQPDVRRHEKSIAEELNVKAVEVLADAGQIAERVGRPNAKLLGPKYGGNVQNIIKLVKQGQFEVLSDGTVKAGEYLLTAAEVEIAYVAKAGLKVEAVSGAVVALDTNLTPELVREGEARDLVRQIQELRKEAELNISDRIELSIDGMPELVAAFADFIKAETLCVGIHSKLGGGLIEKEVEVGSGVVKLALRKSA